MINLVCDCGHTMNVADDLAGKSGKCPKCKAKIDIPFPASISNPAQNQPYNQPQNTASSVQTQTPAPVNYKEKFQVLSILITLSEVGGVVMIGIGVLIALAGLANPGNLLTSFMTASPAAGVGVIVLMMAEGLRVLLEIEKNTRSGQQ